MRLGTGRLAIFVAALLINSPAFAQGRINGLLKQKDGSPVGGAIVVLNERGSAEVTSDAGKYGFDAVAPGKYTLQLVAYQRSDGSPLTMPNGKPSLSLAEITVAP